MKKGWLIALGILLLGVIIAIIWYKRQENRAGQEPYGTAIKPRIEFSSWEITDVDADLVKLKGYMLVDNPLPVGFKAKRMDFDFLMDSSLVVKGDYPKTISVEPTDSTLVMLPIEIPLKRLEAVLKRLDQNNIDSVDYTVHTTFDLEVPILGDRTFSRTITRRLPAVYLPKLKVEKVDIGKVGLKETNLAMKVNINNRNRFPIRFFDTRYTVSIDGDVVAEGAQADSILIKQHGTTPVVLPVTLRPGKLFGMTGKMLFDKKNTPMVIEFHCKVIDRSNNNMFKNSRMSTRIEGTMDEFMAAARQ